LDLRLERSAGICGHLRQSAFQPWLLQLPYPRSSAFIRGQIAVPPIRTEPRPISVNLRHRFAVSVLARPVYMNPCRASPERSMYLVDLVVCGTEPGVEG
jgi:hypothetical protein